MIKRFVVVTSRLQNVLHLHAAEKQAE